MRFVKSFALASAVGGLVCFLTVGTLFTRIEGTQIDKEVLVMDSKPTSVLDKNEDTLAKFFKERRGTVTYEEIPQEIIDALLSTEDREFFEHPGINVRGIARAAIKGLAAGGNFAEGGSTITQQLVKNNFLTTERTFERKQKEAIYATLVEQNFSKKEILTMYLNDTFFGQNAFGIKDALMTYYGQTIEEFNKDTEINRIVKAALLAGIPKGPSIYTPYYSEKAALERRNIVLKNMEVTGNITRKQYDEARELPLMVLEKPNMFFEEQKVDNQEFVHYSLYEASKILGIDVREVMNGGFDIYTSFDKNKYEIIRKNFEDNSLFPSNASDGSKVQGAAVFLNPKNGEIYALSGSRDEINEFLGFNRAFLMERQPGSTFKPIVAYGPALESGKFTPNSMLADDQGHVFPGGYVPRDWDKGGRGQVTMTEAVRQSWNIPAVWTLQQVGIKYATEYAAKLGIDLSAEKSGLSMALGGIDNGVSPLQMADAYQVYANDGYRTPAHTIRKIVDRQGKVIYEVKKSKERVIKSSTAQSMKAMLENAVANGTGGNARIDGRTIAGKSGTTDNGKDIWFVGFEEEFLGAVWMGYDNTDGKERYLSAGSSVTAKMFKEIMEDMLKGVPVKEKPSDLEEYKPITLSLKYNDTKRSMELSWNKVTEEEYIEYDIFKDGKKIQTSESTSYEDVAIEEGKTYSYYVVAYKKEGRKDVEVRRSETKSLAVPKKQIPNVSLKSEYIKTQVAVDLTWNSVGESTTYHIYKNGQKVNQLDNNVFTDTTIEYGQTYTYVIVAYDKNNGQELKRSNESTIVIPHKPVEEEPVDEPVVEEPITEEIPTAEQPAVEETPVEETTQVNTP